MRDAVAPGDALALTRELVAIDSRNPSLDAGGPGEGACARFLARVLEAWGFRAELIDAGGSRPSLVARIGKGGGRSLILNGHLDTVGVERMVHPPFEPVIRDGRLFGRGSADMKSGIAAMCAAAWRAAQDGLAGEVIIAAVADEEYQSVGTRAVIDAGIRADAAIVTEPTRLAICPAHKGFVWADLDVGGPPRPPPHHGVDAIALAAMVVADIERYQQRELTRRSHPLLGRASLHASLVTGGQGLSTYPDRCGVRFERRTLPGERALDFDAELMASIARVKQERPELDAHVTLGFAQEPNDVPVSHPIVAALQAAVAATGRPPVIEGLSCWTDAALFSAAGVPAICFGPGDIALAHSAEEYVPVDEIAFAADALTACIRTWCGTA